MTAVQIVSALLENDEDFDPERWVKARHDTWDKYPLEQRVKGLVGGVRRTGEGYEDQWEFRYKDWLFVLSIYEDGTQIWSAHYKTPVFDWSTPEEKEQGFSWGGGADPQRVPKNYDPGAYLQALKAMADKNPTVWRSRRVPEMPKAY